MTNRERFNAYIEWGEYSNSELAEYIDDTLRSIQDNDENPIACIDKQGRELLTEWLGKEAQE